MWKRRPPSFSEGLPDMYLSFPGLVSFYVLAGRLLASRWDCHGQSSKWFVREMFLKWQGDTNLCIFPVEMAFLEQVTVLIPSSVGLSVQIDCWRMRNLKNQSKDRDCCVLLPPHTEFLHQHHFGGSSKIFYTFIFYNEGSRLTFYPCRHVTRVISNCRC